MAVKRAGSRRWVRSPAATQRPVTQRVAFWCAMVGAGVVAGGVAVAGAAIAGSAAFARAAATPAVRRDTPIEVVRIERAAGQSVVWLRGAEADLPGRYSLIWERGHARVGEIITRAGGLVARTVVTVDEGDLIEGLRCRITGWWYPSAAALADESDDVRDVHEIELPLTGGVAPAWVLRPAKRARPGRGGRWAIHVHGRGALPAETLRGVAPLARAGITNLVMSYRNDPGAPAGDDGRYGFGVTEAADVDAAIQYALEQGASRVTLVGWSMGATACLVAATRGAHRDMIDGLMLESPAIDWPRLLEHQARLHRAPGGLAKLGIALLERGVVAADTAGDGIDFTAVTPAAFARELQVPTLIHASTGDTFVPAAGAEELAKLCPNLVHLRLVDQGEHVKLWNVDAESWERVTEEFVRVLPRPAWRG
ncbi:pimeloyl-ACP methyl ester carboxylesterase [Leucobacter exalbidus]|uniref:Pimeloyl-ACP methyl ester carboxylesterase n=2 Tax=Leucobacter exalbidus TaxID=662960 RepID=A0A940T4V2_9MICO|nr:pimeloyl-ACP methyl ester carboxylesterase [Leucobacter exalbidus]